MPIKYKTLIPGAEWISKIDGRQCHVVLIANESSVDPKHPEVVVFNNGQYMAQNPITFITEHEFLRYSDE